MLGLRQKLMLGFGGLLAITILIGASSIIRIRDLAGAIDVILRENYRSVVAAQDMKESLERMDSAALFTLSGLVAQGRQEIETYRPVFERALAVESGNITIPGEDAQVRIISGRFKEFTALLDKIAAEQTPPEIRRTLYFSKLLPHFNGIKAAADAILRMNQQNMNDANAAARVRASSAIRFMSFFIVGASGIALAFAYLTNRWILQPVRYLTASAAEMARSRLDLVLSVRSKDELGLLAATLNEMAANLRELRRSDQQQVVRSRLAAEEVFRNLPATVALIDLQGRVELVTPSAAQHLALKPGVWVDMLPDAWVKNLYQQALDLNELVELPEDHFVQRFDGGRELFFQPVAIPTHNVSRQQTGVLIMLRDVTQLREQEELKRGVIATVSHQLKTPLTSIRMALHLLLDDRLGALNSKQEELVVAARDDSDRLWRILGDLLSIGHISSGKALLNLQPCMADRLARDAADEFQAAAKDKGLCLSLNLPDELPRVQADPERIAHAFRNLLANAIAYTGPGGEVTLGAEEQSGYVRFFVRDTGTGIAEEYLPHVFEQFFRVPGQTGASGVGLGLAIVREIVTAHGGEVGASSRLGEGSTFWLTLPNTNES